MNADLAKPSRLGCRALRAWTCLGMPKRHKTGAKPFTGSLAEKTLLTAVQHVLSIHSADRSPGQLQQRHCLSRELEVQSHRAAFVGDDDGFGDFRELAGFFELSVLLRCRLLR